MNSIKKFFDSIIYYEYQKNKTYHYIGNFLYYKPNWFRLVLFERYIIFDNWGVLNIISKISSKKKKLINI